jgi:hypothetical protein
VQVLYNNRYTKFKSEQLGGANAMGISAHLEVMQLSLFTRRRTKLGSANQGSLNVIGRDARHKDRTDVVAAVASGAGTQCVFPVEGMHQT